MGYNTLVMKLGSIITLVLVLAGIAFTVRAFVTNTSPYVKVAQLETRGQNVHLPLKPIHETAQFDVKTMTLTFVGEDETGRVKVVYPKGKPNNFEAATQVVAIGSYKDGVFYAEDMLVKCPSKYQGETQTARN
jgi:cytochrome c-type biogenesis protein CcmE